MSRLGGDIRSERTESEAAGTLRAPGTYLDLPAGLTAAELMLYRRAQPFLETRMNDLHVRLSCQYLLALLEDEGGDARLAVPALILHDVGWSQVPEERQRRAFGPNSSDAEADRLHEAEGARLARELLGTLGWPEPVVAEICRIIRTHDSAPVASTLDEALVKDADKLFRVSQIGFPLQIESMFDGTISAQELHDFIAVRAPRWFLTASGLAFVRRELAARREEHGLAPAPDIPPPAGFGIGDAKEYRP
jgi:hypothetical protein